jgi:hypothetical protein
MRRISRSVNEETLLAGSTWLAVKLDTVVCKLPGGRSEVIE